MTWILKVAVTVTCQSRAFHACAPGPTRHAVLPSSGYQLAGALAMPCDDEPKALVYQEWVMVEPIRFEAESVVPCCWFIGKPAFRVVFQSTKEEAWQRPRTC